MRRDHVLFEAETGDKTSHEPGFPVLPERFAGISFRRRQHAPFFGTCRAFLFLPHGEHGELAGKIHFPACGLLDFAARGLGHAVALHEHNGVGQHIKFLHQRGADGRERFFSLFGRELCLEDRNEPLAFPGFHAKGGGAVLLKAGDVLGDAFFHVLREEIAPVHNDHFLAASGDVEAPSVHEAEVSGAEPAPIACIREDGFEAFFRFLLLVPVAGRHARAPEPDFADLVLAFCHAGIRIDDADFRVFYLAAAGDKRPRVGIIFGDGDDFSGRVLLTVKTDGIFASANPCAAGKQGVLGEAVAGVEHFPGKSCSFETLEEPLHGLEADRLGAAVTDPDRAQSKFLQLGIGNTFAAGIIGEIRRTGQIGVIIRTGPEPGKRTAQEGHGRHGDAFAAAEDGRDDAAHETHVMEGGKPAHENYTVWQFHTAADALPVGDDVAMGDNDALGIAGGAGRILQPAGCVWRKRQIFPVRCQPVVHFIKINDGHILGHVHARPQLLNGLHEARVRDDNLRAGIIHDAGEPRESARHARESGGRHGNRDGPGVQTAEKGRNEFQSWRKHEQHRAAVAFARTPNGRSYGFGAGSQPRVIPHNFMSRIAIGQETQNRFVRLRRVQFLHNIYYRDKGF